MKKTLMFGDRLYEMEIMDDSQTKQIVDIINSITYGELVIKKEAGNIVHIVISKSVKLK